MINVSSRHIFETMIDSLSSRLCKTNHLVGSDEDRHPKHRIAAGQQTLGNRMKHLVEGPVATPGSTRRRDRATRTTRQSLEYDPL